MRCDNGSPKVIYSLIVRDGLLEDRMEYTTTDLALMYHLNARNATELRALIHCRHRDNGRGICCECGHVL